MRSAIKKAYRIISNLPSNQTNNINKTKQKFFKILQIIVQANINKYFYNNYQKKAVVEGIEFFSE